MPDVIPVPPEAVTAAALVLADVEGDDQTYRSVAEDVVRAVTPFIGAAGLPVSGDPPQRIRQGNHNPRILYVAGGDDGRGTMLATVSTAGAAKWLCGIVNTATEGTSDG